MNAWGWEDEGSAFKCVKLQTESLLLYWCHALKHSSLRCVINTSFDFKGYEKADLVLLLKAADLVKRAVKRLSNFQFSLKGGPLRILFLPGHLIAFYFLSNSTVFKIAENVSHFCNIFSYTLPSHEKVQQKSFWLVVQVVLDAISLLAFHTL